MSAETNEISQERQRAVSVKEWLSKYFSNWPLFIIFICLCVGSGIIYIRYTTPKYMASTSFIIKGAAGGNQGSDDLIESALHGKKEVNVNNEIMLMNSISLIKRTVKENAFNISYLKKGRILNIDVYKDIPFTLVVKQVSDSNHVYNLHIKKIHQLGGAFFYGPDKAEKLFNFRWNTPFEVNEQQFILTPTTTITNQDVDFIVRLEPVAITAANILENLVVSAFDTKSSVIELTVKTENPQKGQDILNALFAEFSLSVKEDQTKISESTMQFINDRLLAISGELKGVEGNLENYQGSNELIDIKSQTTQSLGNSNDVSKTIKNLSIQQGIATMLFNYFTNPLNKSKLVPSSLGLNDGTLTSLISRYDELQLKKERETPFVAPYSTVMLDLNTQMANLKSSILESINNISKNLKYQENNLRQQNNQYRNLLSSVPHNERVLQEIKRKQGITEGLYLYLLQKREEAAILSAAANLAHYKQIDPAVAIGLVEPNTKKIIAFMAILGLLITFSWIYIRELFNDTIMTVKDVHNILSIPIAAEIGHISKKRNSLIPVVEYGPNSEEFRTLRTNILLNLKDKTKRTILITSSNNGEGKSFISLNLAAVLALPGNKVALLKFDFNKPILNNMLSLNDNNRGLTDFLTGKISDISEISQVVAEVPNLHVFNTGKIVYSSADLLLTENIHNLFDVLKEKYDYIIIDSSPVGLVSDSFILNQYTDMVLYIIRQRKTLKKHLMSIEHISRSKKLTNIDLIFNDVKKGSRYS